MSKVLLTGDINLMNVKASDTPFRHMLSTLASADVVMSNLECALYEPSQSHTVEHEGFFADPEVGGKELVEAGISVVGVANNVNYGEAAILSSMATLDRFAIPHAGAGENLAAARKPVVLNKHGVRYGFLQRTSIYWATNHEAHDASVGVAVIRGNTAFQVLAHREPYPGGLTPPFNRPGIPPKVITWAEQEYLDRYAEDVKALRQECDFLVASCHWGLGPEVLTYMEQIARVAIDAGADVVMGHGPHRPLPISFYKEKPIFYGLGSFSFHTGHMGQKHGDWIGLLAQIETSDGQAPAFSVSLVRNNDDNETMPLPLAEVAAPLEALRKASLKYGAVLTVEGDRVVITQAPPKEKK